MKRLIEFPLEDGSTIVVETDDAPAAGTVRGAHPSEVVEKAKQTFEASLERIKPVAASIIAKLRELGDRPEQVGGGIRNQAKRSSGRSARVLWGGGKPQSDVDMEAGTKRAQALTLKRPHSQDLEPMKDAEFVETASAVEDAMEGTAREGGCFETV